MKKRILKRIFVFACVTCLVMAAVPTVSFAVDPVTGAMALAGAIDAYGMAYGVGTVYDVSSSSGVSSSFEGLWDDFSSYQSNAGSQFDYDSYIENYNQNRSLYGFEHSSGKFAAWSIDAESAEIFDQFWNWLLTGPAEMTRVDNEYFQFSSSQIGSEAVSIPVISIPYGPFADQPIPSTTSSNPSASFIRSSGLELYHNSSGSYRVYAVSRNSFNNVFVFAYVNGSNYSIVFASPVSSSLVSRAESSNDSISYSTCSSFDSSRGLYYSSPVNVSSSYYTVLVPRFESLDSGLTSLSSVVSEGNPSDTIGVKSYTDSGLVDLPNPYGQDYIPTPLEIVTNVLWDSTYDDSDEEDGSPVPFPPSSVPLVVDDIISAISAEDYSIEEDPQDPDPDPPPPAPSEVFVPLLPVGLPSFNFSLSGIWHYVREWVASLGAWFSTMFTVWSALPYAMVVPVYATAVVVIVLGLYKRFFM